MTNETRAAAPPSDEAVGSIDQAGRVEALGVEHVPEDQRHGRPRELFGVWAGATLTPLYLILGGALMASGLGLWPALAALAIGSATFALVAWQGVAGARSGTTTLMISRAMYGWRGNLISAFFTWFSLVAFQAVNFVVGATALQLVLQSLGLGISPTIQVICLVTVIVIAGVTAYYGHATIVTFQSIATWALAIGAAVLFFFVLDDVNWGYAAPAQDGTSPVALWFLGLGIIVSGAISWCPVPADYTRYLPSRTSARAIVGWTTAGSALTAGFLGLIGVLAGTAVDMSDPFAALGELVPTWVYIPLMLVLLLGSLTNNVLTIYSSAMALQALGIRIKRYLGVVVNALIGAAMAFYAVFVTDFLTALTEFLQLALMWYAPFTAIFLVDMVLRRSRYDWRLLLAGPGSRYGNRMGINVAGVVALILGMAVGLPFANTARFQGAFSAALDGIDLSYIVSFVVAGAAYALLARRRIAEDLADLSRSSDREETR